MPINSQLIEETQERFFRERDRYEKLTRTVESICLEKLAEGSSLMVNITSRTKGISSFSRKLQRFMQRGDKDAWHTVDDIFAGISDLSGVRIAYYLSNDLEGIKEALSDLFNIPGGFDVKNKKGFPNPPHSNYQAIHCQVELREDDLIGGNENLRGLTCEIQICSMMAHVWNEVEHDIAYKPFGQLGSEEIIHLTSLAEIVCKGDEVIQKLIESHTKRVKGEDLIGSPTELATFVADLFCVRRVTFWHSVGKAYDALSKLDLLSKSALQNAISVDMEMPEAKRREIWKNAKSTTSTYNKKILKIDKSEFQLSERNSIDPIIMILVEKKASLILKMLPAGRGKGRPTWIRSIASRHLESFATRKANESPRKSRKALAAD